MSRLYRVAGGDEIAARRGRLAAGSVIEAWTDLYSPGRFWLGEESKRLLDGAGEPMPTELSLPADSVAVYYGPQLSDIESLPSEDSLKARVLSGHGIAVAWITLDRFGQRISYQPQAPSDPIFHLRRRGGGAGHIWRLFTAKKEAVVYLTESHGAESEAVEWAESLAVEDFESLLQQRGGA